MVLQNSCFFQASIHVVGGMGQLGGGPFSAVPTCGASSPINHVPSPQSSFSAVASFSSGSGSLVSANYYHSILYKKIIIYRFSASPILSHTHSDTFSYCKNFKK